MKYQLCPSILSADFNCLGAQMQTLADSGIEVVHIDVMDGAFVPSISFGMPVIRSIRKKSELFFDVHLMVEEPDRYTEEFVKCGADSLTVHLEACKDVKATLEHIRSLGVRTGLSIKPKTSFEEAVPYLDLVDMLLIMTVEPGFGGQKYIESSTEKIIKARRFMAEHYPEINIQVDGGVNDSTMDTVIGAGANWIVAGSYCFGENMKAAVGHAMEKMNAAINKQQV